MVPVSGICNVCQIIVMWYNPGNTSRAQICMLSHEFRTVKLRRYPKDEIL
ncbi:hypothetical protein FHT91_003911 [Rhizobium sp. BK347]|nr:hypothetical protein [Rhizobium sp. BK252]MBB3403669.1 hypothetical protein [Rhizobium sp. BK289]MBB3416146.1 hypothetical protein [Rhizobium sp. BK284]MBB3484132.1 hypothetical protein [Rhizobium sp. BK347]